MLSCGLVFKRLGHEGVDHMDTENPCPPMPDFAACCGNSLAILHHQQKGIRHRIRPNLHSYLHSTFALCRGECHGLQSGIQTQDSNKTLTKFGCGELFPPIPRVSFTSDSPFAWTGSSISSPKERRRLRCAGPHVPGSDHGAHGPRGPVWPSPLPKAASVFCWSRAPVLPIYPRALVSLPCHYFAREQNKGRERGADPLCRYKECGRQVGAHTPCGLVGI